MLVGFTWATAARLLGECDSREIRNYFGTCPFGPQGEGGERKAIRLDQV